MGWVWGGFVVGLGSVGVGLVKEGGGVCGVGGDAGRCESQVPLQRTCCGAHCWFDMGLGMQGEGLGMVFKSSASAKNMFRKEFPITRCVVSLHWVCGSLTLGVCKPIASAKNMLWGPLLV